MKTPILKKSKVEESNFGTSNVGKAKFWKVLYVEICFGKEQTSQCVTIVWQELQDLPYLNVLYKVPGTGTSNASRTDLKLSTV